MPYTPPSQQSPATSTANSPALSRSSSYSEDGPRLPSTGRPSLPRSNSSTSYMHRHRRSPSITNADGSPPTPTLAADPKTQAADFAFNGSVRQPPPPANKNLIPTGAVISPPDSPENSDGDDNAHTERGRELEKTWTELQEAVRGINQRRESSPNKDEPTLSIDTKSEPVSQITSPTALSKEARKISHSRSSTEIVIPRTQFEESPVQGSDDSEEDDGLMTKPSLVRKKSGELVKPALRPSARRRYSSMPGTPTYGKSVHFNDSDNQTRHFLQVDKPIAVSAGTSPVETYDSESEFPFEAEPKTTREIQLSNFPADTFERRMKPIRVEKIFLSADRQTLIGICAVQNISFQKLVVARFTLDYWKTTSEVVAEFNNDPQHPKADGCDRFNFHIKLSDQANIDSKTLLLCVRYNVGGQVFWDNNDHCNYQIDFTKVTRKPSPPVTNGLGARPLNAIPRSRQSPPRSASGPRASVDDDFAARVDSSSEYGFGSPDKSFDKLLGEAPGSIKLKPRTKRGSVFPTVNGSQSANGLGGRYDFGASLSAALSTAQDKLGRQSGLMNAVRQPSSGSYFGPVERNEGPVKTDERPDAITTDRPAMGSDQYKDLVQKFCYFTPSSGKQASTPPQRTIEESKTSKPAAKTDGTNEEEYDSSSSSSSSPDDSATSSPVIDESSGRREPAVSPFASRPTSPSPVTGMGGRAPSPISFGYPYHHNSRDGYLSDSQTPTAIRG